MQELSSEEVKGCTVGVVYVSDGILFFKNRDLAQKYLVKGTTTYQSTPEIYIVKGVNFETAELEGVSIGVNRHSVCVANTHVVSTTDVTYDVLCEKLVNETQQRQDVPKVVADFIQEVRMRPQFHGLA